MVLAFAIWVAAVPADSWGLKWKAPKGCIEPAQLARAVETQLGRTVFGGNAKLRIDGELTKAAQAPRWRAKFIAVDGEGSILGSRELSSDDASCRALDDKLALSVAVMIDPKRGVEPEPETARPPAPEPPPAVRPLAPAPPVREADPAAVEEYERRVIHFGDWVAVNQTGTIVAQGTQPFQGKFMKQLTAVEFYRTIGEADRVELLEARGRVKSALIIPGFSLLGAGLIAMFAGIFIAGDCPLPALNPGISEADFQSCLSRRNTIRDVSLWGSVGVMAVGLVLGLAGIFVPYPVDEAPVLREKAERYNKKLKRELGLDGGDDEGPAPLSPRAPPNPQAFLTPLLMPNGGGLALGVRF